MAKERAKGARRSRKKADTVEAAQDLIPTEVPITETSQSPQGPHHIYPIGTTLANNKGWYCKDELSKEPGTLACRLDNDPQAYEHAECGAKSNLPVTNLDMTLEQVGAYEDLAARAVDMSKAHPYIKDDLARRLGYTPQTETPGDKNLALDEKIVFLTLALVRWTVGLPYTLPNKAYEHDLIKHPRAITAAIYSGIVAAAIHAINPESTLMSVTTTAMGAGGTIAALYAVGLYVSKLPHAKKQSRPEGDLPL